MAALTSALHLRPRFLPSSSEPVRVAFFVETGAASRFWETSIPLVAEAGYDVEFISLQGPGLLHESLRTHGVKTFALSCTRSAKYPQAALELSQLLRHHNVDILHCSEPIQAAVGGVSRFVYPHPVSIFHRQHTRPPSEAQGKLSQIGGRLCHYTLACSQATADWARHVDKVPPAKLHVALYGVPPHREVSTDEIDDIKNRLGIAPTSQVILLPGYLRLQKGHRVLIEALPEIESRVSSPVDVIFVGSGVEESSLRQLCQHRDNIHFVGYQHDIAAWFATADVVTMPSLYEAFGLTAVEAFAARLPLVASRVEGLQEIVTDDSCGVLVPPDDVSALARAVSDVLNSPSQAKALGASAYERFSRHLTVGTMVEGWLDLYRKIVRAKTADIRVPSGDLGR